MTCIDDNNVVPAAVVDGSGPGPEAPPDPGPAAGLTIVGPDFGRISAYLTDDDGHIHRIGHAQRVRRGWAVVVEIHSKQVDTPDEARALLRAIGSELLRASFGEAA